MEIKIKINGKYCCDWNSNWDGKYPRTITDLKLECPFRNCNDECRKFNWEELEQAENGYLLRCKACLALDKKEADNG